jgi:hypothetical protein
MMGNKRGRPKQKIEKPIWQDSKRKTGSQWETRYKNAELRFAN